MRNDRPRLDSRSYLHDVCRKATGIGDGSFVKLANPYAGVTRTICAACETDDTLDKFRWTDTKEPLSEWRRRVVAAAPPAGRYIMSGFVVLSVLFIGLIAVPTLFSALRTDMSIMPGLFIAVVLAYTAFLFYRTLLPRIVRALLRVDLRGMR